MRVEFDGQRPTLYRRTLKAFWTGLAQSISHLTVMPYDEMANSTHTRLLDTGATS